MSYGDTILTATLAGAFIIALIIMGTAIMTPDPTVVKIMRSELPPCNSTVGSPDGYYCQINNTSFFCKVDATQPDPFVRTHAYCQEVVFV